ncbi:uncharacterized protein LOC121250507 [Juglans microcarpa x Juglans regia]|uniref:uncharacterized protein LOC121250495 n=1 Tax=Juglans microcarpa x Juglans regia TaxID=2249226 RepID=UPI001B7F0DB1|nr:uncharacterized protein LOC121250495 [Juglans microcarpa x Juglans regia]XP_041005574.1 uncharacterized protein LOC121250507 [Juglans microcarpa x Juglans regia]
MDLNTIKVANSCFVLVLLGHAIEGDFISPHHSNRIFEAYMGDKNIIKFEATLQWHRGLKLKVFFVTIYSKEEMSSTAYTHWCYQCWVRFRLEVGEVVCPFCDRGFIQELSEMQDLAPEDVSVPISGYHYHQAPDIMDFLYALMTRRSPNPRLDLMDYVDAFMRQRMAGRNPNFDVRVRSGLVPEQS